MPPPVDPTDTLVERVAAAIFEANDGPRWSDLTPDLHGMWLREARAAIRVVVEACAEVCDQYAENNLRSHERYRALGVETRCVSDVYQDAASGVRRLAPKEKP